MTKQSPPSTLVIGVDESAADAQQQSVVVAVDNAMSVRHNVKRVVSAVNAFILDSDASTPEALASDVQTLLRQKFDDEISVAHKTQPDNSVMLLLVYGHDHEVKDNEPKMETPQWLN